MVGFGQKKSIKENTGAVSTLKSSSIKDLPVASVDKAFMGRVAGVQTEFYLWTTRFCYFC